MCDSDPESVMPWLLLLQSVYVCVHNMVADGDADGATKLAVTGNGTRVRTSGHASLMYAACGRLGRRDSRPPPHVHRIHGQRFEHAVCRRHCCTWSCCDAANAVPLQR